MVEDKVGFSRLVVETMREALPVPVTAVFDWQRAMRAQAVATRPPGCLVTAMSHHDALSLRREMWGLVSTVLVDTHDSEREWRLRLEEKLPQAAVYAGGAVANLLLGLAQRPRVICYSVELRSPLVKVLLWQQTEGKADGYYLAESFMDHTILRSALIGDLPLPGQVAAPNERDYVALGVRVEAPLYGALERAQASAERWEIVGGYRTLREATAGARRWFERESERLGTEGPRAATVIKLLRRAASGYRNPS